MRLWSSPKWGEAMCVIIRLRSDVIDASFGSMGAPTPSISLWLQLWENVATFGRMLGDFRIAGVSRLRWSEAYAEWSRRLSVIIRLRSDVIDASFGSMGAPTPFIFILECSGKWLQAIARYTRRLGALFRRGGVFWVTTTRAVIKEKMPALKGLRPLVPNFIWSLDGTRHWAVGAVRSSCFFEVPDRTRQGRRRTMGP